MKATPEQQGTLLNLQQADLKMARLKHQMANHPTREKIAELRARADDLQRFTVGMGAQIDDQQRELAKVEAEIEKVRTRREVQQERLDSGKVGIRDMSAVEHEIQRIQERQDDLEAVLLEQMERLETSESRLEAAKQQAQVLIAEGKKASAQLDEELQEPTSELDQLSTRRTELAQSLPSDVIDEYERLRDRQGPIVVLHLDGGMLVNSPVSVSQEELDSAAEAPADELFFSEEAGYLIARP